MQQLKILGERNCGTRLLEEVARSDGRFDVLAGSAPPGVRRVASWVPVPVAEKLLDLVDGRRRTSTLGWKHAWPDGVVTRGLAEADIVAVAAVKHPLSWCVSLRASPHHLRRLDGGDLGVMHLAREHLPCTVERYRDLWWLKATRYVELQEQGLLRILRFEELIEDPVHQLLDAAGLGPRAGGPVEVPSVSLKADGRSRCDILEHYRAEAWRPHVTEEDVRWASTLPSGLLSALGYSL